MKKVFRLETVWRRIILLAVLFWFLHCHLVFEKQLSSPSRTGIRLSHFIGSQLSTNPMDESSFHSTTSTGTSNNGTIIIQLSGEMGNNLHKLAFGRGLQLMAEREFNLDLQIVLRHQEHPKWISTRRNLQKCFPNLKNLDFSGGNTEEFGNRKIEQKLWLGIDAKGLELQGNDEGSMMTVLENLKRLSERKGKLSKSIVPVSKTNIHLPFVLADQMVDWHILNRYRPELLQWLQFDYESCCPSDLPDQDESVFHFRNFVTELRGATSSLGFEELSPARTANELFGHLQPGEKIAITTRFDNSVTREYAVALKDKGLKVRVVVGNSDTEDFCFLAKTKKELVGGQRSSFFTWAAFLGVSEDDISGIKQVRSYSVHPPQRSIISNSLQLPYQWDDHTLKAKWRFEVFGDSLL